MSSPAGIRGLRGRLLATVLVAVAIAVVAITAAFNLVLASRLDSDANDLLRSRASSTLATLSVVDGRVRAPEAPDEATLDRPIWIFAGGRGLERPQAGAAIDRAARGLADGPERRVDVRGASVRLLALPVVAGGRRVGTVVAGISLTPYERTRRVALFASCALAALLLGAAALAARWLLAAGLRPIGRMTRDAAEWSERDLDRRFGLGAPRDEFTRLAATLDGLLDRLAAGLRRERRFSAELSHELRTPLSRIRAQAEVALAEDAGRDADRAALAEIVDGVDDTTRALDALLSDARAEVPGARGSTEARAAALAASEGCAALAAERAVRLEVVPSPPLRVGADADLVERMLHPLVENACRYARRHARITVRRDGTSVVYVVEDDGPGVAEEERERIFEPGVRGSAAVASRSGAGLGLALVRRLARAAGGDVDALPSTDGARFEVRLPAA